MGLCDCDQSLGALSNQHAIQALDSDYFAQCMSAPSQG